MLDGHNNPGFSGGPVIFKENGKPQSNFCVASVISGYKEGKESVVAGDERGVMSIDMGDGIRMPLEIYMNTGVVFSHSISHAIDAIRDNPIGAD